MDVVVQGNRITAVRQMILAEDEAGRRAALDRLLPEQRKDFTELFDIMAGLPPRAPKPSQTVKPSKDTGGGPTPTPTPA